MGMVYFRYSKGNEVKAMTMFILGILVMSAVTTVPMWITDEDIPRVLCGGPVAWLSAIVCLAINRILVYARKYKKR